MTRNSNYQPGAGDSERDLGSDSKTGDDGTSGLSPGKRSLVETSFPRDTRGNAPANGMPGKRTLIETLPQAGTASGFPFETEVMAFVGPRSGKLSSSNPTGASLAVASSHATTPASQATAAGVTAHSALDRALDLAKLGQAHLAAIESALLPAYRSAVKAMDTAAVKALGLQIVGGVARIVEAQGQIIQLVPQVDTSRQAARTSTPVTDPGSPDPAALAALAAQKEALDAAVQAKVPNLSVAVSPQWFGDQLVAGRAAEPAPHVREVLVQLAYESGLVVQLLEEADTIEGLVKPTDKVRGTSEPATDEARKQAVDRLERWKGRPINFLFLQRVLTQRGVWQLMQGVRDGRDRTADDLQRKVFAQSMETGRTSDVGEEWDANEAHDALSYSRWDWKVTDAEAMKVFEMLSQAEPRARAGLVKQLQRMGRLGAMCEHLPWQLVKQLWESISDPEASKMLEPYWASKGGGASLGKRLEAQDHWYTHALSRFLDIATFGAKPRIDAAYDAREEGTITDDAYWGHVTKSVGRAAFTAAAAAATGGVAGELVAGASEGMGLATGLAGRVGTAMASGATAGGMGNVSAHLVGDMYDQVLDGKQGFDSLSAYGQSFKEGAILGGVTGAAGLAASRFLAPANRTVAQSAAAANPQLTRILEAARNVGVGAGQKLQIRVGDLVDSLQGGAPPGLRFALAGAGGEIPPRIAKLPPEATAWITVRPLQDLNAPQPMQMQSHARNRDLVEIVDIDPESGSLFDKRDPESNVRDDHFETQPDENASEFSDGYKITKRLPPGQDPNRPTWQESESHVSESLDWAGFKEQTSFVQGEQVSRGTAGSTRPDNYSAQFRLSVEVKNYKVMRGTNQTRLVKDIVEQITDRAAHLPRGVRQGVVIDARGQVISANRMASLRSQIVQKSNGLLAPDDIVFLPE